MGSRNPSELENQAEREVEEPRRDHEGDQERREVGNVAEKAIEKSLEERKRREFVEEAVDPSA